MYGDADIHVHCVNFTAYLAVISDEHDPMSRIYRRRAEIASLYSYHYSTENGLESRESIQSSARGACLL